MELPDGSIQEICWDIYEERLRQDKKWGDQSGNKDSVWSTVLTEEVGEAAQEVLRYEYGTDINKSIALSNLRAELIQVAAVAVAWVEALDKRAG
jgi:NTP pyrophosphatase (non-canonical NTP hydrolase)